MKKIVLLLLGVIGFIDFSYGQIPPGYYNSAAGLTGNALRVALHDIIDGHSSQSYDALWSHFYSTDRKSNNKVWDMYSDVPSGTPAYEFTFYTQQCGSYDEEGDCYNREHSFPASWFNDGSPMYTDLFHLVPTDGYVNNMRGNYAFGEVNSPTWTSTNGSKRGPNAYTGYSGTAFEPIDAYKGDFARNYFYMMVRYYGSMGSWDGPMMSGGDLAPWALNMLRDWHLADPVSQKEIDRNNAVYAIQGNRNPFIDYPDWVCSIWGGCVTAIQFTSTPIFQININSLYSYNITASGSNLSLLHIYCPVKPQWLSFADNGNGNASLTGTPDNSHIGIHPVSLMLTDGTDTVYQNFEISVDEPGTNVCEGIESFTNLPATSPASYENRSWTGDNASTWTATSARTDQTIDGKAVCLKDQVDAYVQSGNITGGCNAIVFTFQQKFSGSGGQLTLKVNNNQIGQPVAVTTAVDSIVYNNVNVSGDFVIKISTNGAARIAIDNIRWCTTSLPQIGLSTTSLANFGNVIIGQSSAVQTYKVCGQNLGANMLIKAPASFVVSQNGTDFADSLLIPANAGVLDSTLIYVKFVPQSEGSISGFIRHTSDGSGLRSLAVSGTGLVNIAEHLQKGYIHVFPNPFKTNLHVMLPGINEKTCVFKVFNVHGKEVYNEKAEITGESVKVLPLNDLAVGIYILQVNVGSQLFQYRIMKE